MPNWTLTNCQLNYSANSSQPPLQSSTQLPTLNWTLSLTNQLLHFISFHSTQLNYGIFKVKVALQLAVYCQLVCLGVKLFENHDQRYIFSQLNSCGNSPYVTSSLRRKQISLLGLSLAFRQVYISHIQRVTDNASFWTTHKSSVSTDFVKQIVSILSILRYNGSFIWTVVTAKFKP
jgi:hypothetical protein